VGSIPITGSISRQAEATSAKFSESNFKKVARRSLGLTLAGAA
jgi:hypothetical protein